MSSTPSSAPETPWWQRLVLDHRIPISAAFVLTALFFSHPSRFSVLYGLPFILLGQLLRLWASGHIHKMSQVTRTGPYALCRHPLYLGHAIITLGFLVATGNPWLIPAGIAAFLLIFLPTMQREEFYLTQLFGQEYSDYMQAVPRFLPRWSRQTSEGSFDWQLVRQHREWNNIYGLAGGIALFVGLGLWLGTW